MNDLESPHVVLGTGPLGLAVVRALRRAGRPTRVVNRTGIAAVPDGVEVVRADLTDVASATAACRGAAVVFLCANAPMQDWPDRWPQLMHGAVEGAVAARARLVYGDDLYMYGPVAGPLHEDLPNAAKGAKGLTRAIVADQLMEVHRSGKLQAAIGRASDCYGPGVTVSFAGEQVFGRALRGRPARLLGDPDVPHTYTYIDDFGAALVTLGAREEAFGSVWHVPNDAPVTQRQFVAHVFEALGASTPGPKAPGPKTRGPKTQLRTTPRWLVHLMGRFDVRLRELEELLYTVERPFVVDHSRYAEAFGADVTPLAEGIRLTVDWYRSRQAPERAPERASAA